MIIGAGLDGIVSLVSSFLESWKKTSCVFVEADNKFRLKIYYLIDS